MGALNLEDLGHSQVVGTGGRPSQGDQEGAAREVGQGYGGWEPGCVLEGK